MRSVLLRLCALALCVAPALACAAEWSVRSGAQIYGQTETNPRTLAHGAQDAQAGVVDASTALVRRTELDELALNGSAQLRRYSEEVALDRDEQQLDLTWRHRGERSQMETAINVARDTTLSSELGSTGITQNNLRHLQLSGSLSPSAQLSERTTLGAKLGWQESRYKDGELVGLFDYRYQTIGTNAAYLLSERASVGLQLNAGRLNSDASDVNMDNYDARLSGSYKWSSRWSGTLSAGPSRMHIGSRTAGGSVYGASVARESERFTLYASLQRRVAPSGSGYFTRRDDASLSIAAALFEHVDGSIGVSLVRSRDYVPSFGFTFSDVRYRRADASVYWQFARDWSLGASAAAREQKQQFGNIIGRGFEARVQLAWRRVAPVG